MLTSNLYVFSLFATYDVKITKPLIPQLKFAFLDKLPEMIACFYTISHSPPAAAVAVAALCCAAKFGLLINFIVCCGLELNNLISIAVSVA